MILVLLTMLLILAMAGLVAVYVIYPRRGLDVPRMSWLGDVLDRVVGALPTLGGEPARVPVSGDRRALR